MKVLPVRLTNSYFFMLVLLSLFSSGCLTLDRMTMIYEIKEDLSGYVDVYASRVRSEESDPLEQQSEMAELYAGFDDRDGVSGFEKEMRQNMPGYRDWKLDVLNKTVCSCDIHVRGYFDSFIDLHIFDSTTLQYQVEGEKVIVRLKIDDLKDGDLPVFFKLLYHGPVLEHNAMQVEPVTNTLVWDLSKFNDDLYFVLSSEQMNMSTLQDPQEGVLSFFERKYGDQLYACERDQDCAGGKTNCCYGVKGISKQFQQEWQTYLDRQCGDIDCPQEGDPRGSLLVCQQQKCLMKPRNYSLATFSDCLQMLNPQEKGRCYLDVASRQKDMSGCFYIDQKDLQLSCLQLLIPQVPIKDETICLEQAIASDYGLSALCWQRLAQDVTSPYYCGHIQDPVTLSEIQKQSRCYRETIPLVQSVSDCEPFDPNRMQDPNIGYLFGTCIQQIALKQGRPDVCQRIPEGTEYYSYWFNCITGVAEQAQNDQFCRSLNTRQAPAGYSDAFTEAGCRKKVQKGHF